MTSNKDFIPLLRAMSLALLSTSPNDFNSLDPEALLPTRGPKYSLYAY